MSKNTTDGMENESGCQSRSSQDTSGSRIYRILQIHHSSLGPDGNRFWVETCRNRWGRRRTFRPTNTSHGSQDGLHSDAAADTVRELTR